MPAPLVLGYHAVSPTWDWTFSVSPRQLERQVGHLLRRGRRGVTFAELCSSGRRDAFAVTFDDGYRSVLRLAAPILGRLGVPATVFAVTSFVDAGVVGGSASAAERRRQAEPHEVEALSWDELRTLAEAGWEIGSHTVTHPALTTLPVERVAEELRESRSRLERELGRPCPSLAYPYGDHDERVVATADAEGYAFACVFPPTHAARGRLAVPRVGVYRGDGARSFALKTSGVARSLRASSLGAAAGSLRRGRRQ